MGNENKIHRILLIEPSPVVRAGIQAIIESNKAFKIVGWIPDLYHLSEHLAMMRADIVIINPVVVEFHRRFSLKTIFQDFPEIIPVAIVYGHMDIEALKQYQAVIDIYDNQLKIEAKLRDVVNTIFEPSENTENYELSEREKEILIAVAKGMTNKEIADTHNISVHTVISHRKNISRKTGIKSVSGMTVYALLNNLIDQNKIY